MRVRQLMILALAVAAMPWASFAQDVRKPPLATDRTYVPELGWAAASDQIGESLRKAYQPGRAGMAGSVANSGFQQWLALARWAELLSRVESAERARFLGNFLVQDPSKPGNALVWLGSGIELPEDLVTLEADQLNDLLDNPNAVRPFVETVLPPSYVPWDGSVADGLDPEFLLALTSDNTFLDQFFALISEHDFIPAVLKNLESIWRAHPEKWAEYQNLALAISVVHDQQPPQSWPHHQVQTGDVPTADVTPVGIFDFFVTSQADSKLLMDPRSLGADHLRFVVDAPIDFDEFRWAQRHARFPRTDFGRAFSSISYRNDRVQTESYGWTEGPYTLEAIEEQGGICVDQAYFAFIAGKAKGLPTLYFSGQGSAGGHAWFGYMKGEDRWDLDCGRYASQNYPVGQARDPQTWLPINDHQLESLSENFRRTPAYLASLADLAMARLFEDADDPENALAAAESAIAISPQNELAWEEKSRLLAASNADATDQIAHHEAALKQFGNDKDLRVAHQLRLVSLHRAAGDDETAQKLESQIILQNRRARSDLSVSAAAQQLGALIESGDLEKAMQEYRRQISSLGRTAGGNFFYEIVRPFSHALADAGDTDSAKRAVDLARTALKPSPGSILAKELDELNETVANGTAAR